MRQFLLIAGIVSGLSSGSPVRAGLLGSIEYPRSGKSAASRWAAMLARTDEAGDPCAAIMAGPMLAGAVPDITPAAAAISSAAPVCRAGNAAHDLHRAADRARALPPAGRIQLINAAVNRRPYVPDKSNYGVDDYWATLDEFAARGGDCEDYAIAKYMLLKEAGIPAADMRILVVHDLVLDAPHAVLGVDVGGTWYILDNQAEAALRDSEVTYYRPVYSINERGWWLHVPS